MARKKIKSVPIIIHYTEGWEMRLAKAHYDLYLMMQKYEKKADTEEYIKKEA